jgi:hypothetical protein
MQSWPGCEQKPSGQQTSPVGHFVMLVQVRVFWSHTELLHGMGTPMAARSWSGAAPATTF